MGKLTFIAGLAAGYVLGAKAGTQRYEQIRRGSNKLWHSEPVQKQVGVAKEAARTKAAPVVADLVADAARATASSLRQGRTVASEALHSGPGDSSDDGSASTSAASGTGTTGEDHRNAWSAATRPTTTD